MMSLAPPRARRRPSLTPMIDVVFLLLVFFMLAARFGVEGGLRLDLAGPGAADGYSGPPRLIDVLPEGQRLNGVPQDMAGLMAALPALMAGPEDIIVLRPRDGAALQRLVDLSGALAGAGFSRVVVLP
jgi:biopolymer transport protein ExbD